MRVQSNEPTVEELERQAWDVYADELRAAHVRQPERFWNRRAI